MGVLIVRERELRKLGQGDEGQQEISKERFLGGKEEWQETGRKKEILEEFVEIKQLGLILHRGKCGMKRRH